MDLKHRLLRESFGYAEFRPGQQQLIDAMLEGRDVLGVMPTGAGKSICYQIAGLLLPGVSLILSPLISLMHDQVAALQRVGIPAGLLNSTQSAAQRAQTLQQVMQGRCKLLYVAPERLETAEFTDTVGQLPISMITIDEAHCISQWGHDFRPSYRSIPRFIQSLPKRPILSAFTATATAQVREDIVQALGLLRPVRLVTSFDRPNLHYAVRRAADREAQLLRFIHAQQGASGIVYCLTRRKTEELAQYLCDNGIAAVAYHAGLTAAVRQQAQLRFVSGTIPVIVATNAFGMGINKPDVRFVVHFGMSRDLESYYQEAGRAGRDGAPAQCLLLFDESDFQMHEYLTQKDPENPALTDEEVAWLKRRNRRRLRQMKHYVFTQGCLRQYILRYFDQDAPDFCGTCSNCEAASQEKDITVDAQKVLSCVYRVKEQADADMLCRILLGEGSDEMRQLGYDTLSTFGIMRGSKKEILAVIDRLLSLGDLVRQEGPQPRLRLTARAKQVLFHGQTVSLRVPVSRLEAKLRRVSLHSEHPELARQLAEYRKRIADRRGIPEQGVFSDQLLERIVHALPTDERALRTAIGDVDSLALHNAIGALPIVIKYLKN